MTAQKKTDQKEKIILKALELATAQGWDNVSLIDIARSSGITLADLHDLFDDKTDILIGFGRMIDRKVLENAQTPSPGISPRDALFDLLMDRFDTLNDHRTGITAVIKSFKCDPKQALIGTPHLCRSMSWMLESAGINTDGIKGAVKVSALTALYLKTTRIWLEDESEDLAKVMAALDKDLARIEKWAGNLAI